ncbi:unnamed protein product [Amoebophrya sp. A25]|nr:unnamed protein product [Amoebophrya sp. A25]|eukprot:GSA25T00002836001.1
MIRRKFETIQTHNIIRNSCEFSSSSKASPRAGKEVPYYALCNMYFNFMIKFKTRLLFTISMIELVSHNSCCSGLGSNCNTVREADLQSVPSLRQIFLVVKLKF